MGINTEPERAVCGEQSDQTGTSMAVFSVFTWTRGKAKSLLRKHTLQNQTYSPAALNINTSNCRLWDGGWGTVFSVSLLLFTENSHSQFFTVRPFNECNSTTGYFHDRVFCFCFVFLPGLSHFCKISKNIKWSHHTAKTTLFCLRVPSAFVYPTAEKHKSLKFEPETGLCFFGGFFNPMSPWLPILPVPIICDR